MSDAEPTGDDNPFKGTPMEQFFAQMSQGNVDLGQLMNQMQQMFQPHEGTVNYVLSKDVARSTVAAAGDDPTPTQARKGAVEDAVRLAEMWLDRVTDLPAGASKATAWSRADWVENSMDTWRVLIEPIASHVVSAMSDAMPAEAKAAAGPLMGLLEQAGGALFGQQVGQGVGALAAEVLSSSEIGLPVTTDRNAALVVTNISALATELEQTEADVMLHVALRECAHHRLHARATWLRAALIGAVEDYGRGTVVDISAIESQLRDIDPTQPEAMAEAFNGGLFEPVTTPDQQRAKDRLELLLALSEGWVDEVVSRAAAEVMPSASALGEAMRRRRATGGPAEETFASLVGLELRPRRLREAANLWAAVRDRRGTEVRDDIWSHPDLMPDAQDLHDPLAFVERISHSGSDLDTELEALLGRSGDEE